MASLDDMFTGAGGGVSLVGGGSLILAHRDADGHYLIVTGGCCQAKAAGTNVLWYGLQAALAP